MKKFLIFLVAVIVTVCIGMVFYQFAKNEEVVKVDATTIYVNYGEKLSLSDIGFKRIDSNKDTKFNFNAGGEEVESIIKYDEATGCYIPTQKGGATTIKITTSLRKYKTFSIDVIVGTGSEEHPYYISNQEQLSKIGTEFKLDACYALVSDIELTQKHTPIGLIDGKYNEFTGRFNGNYKTISNITIDSCDYAGLFAILGAPSVVYNLSLESVNMVGSYINVGAVAGTCYGNINKIVVSNANIANTRDASNTGAIVGLLQTDNTAGGASASLLRSSATTDSNTLIKSSGTLGGLVGKANSAVIQACYSAVCLENINSSFTGGLVGELEVDSSTYIRECYTISTIKGGLAGNIAGKISLANGVDSKNVNCKLVLVGLYYNSEICSAPSANNDALDLTSASGFGVRAKTTAEMKKKATYIYYVNSQNRVVYWDKVWYLVDGEYPTLTFVSKFDDVVINDKDESAGDTNIPDNPDIENPDIDDPSTPNENAILLSSKADVVKYFQHSTQVSGDFIITTDINLDGMSWTPINFKGSLKSSSDFTRTISNFTINSASYHTGFFASLSSATIERISLMGATLVENGEDDTAGILVGYIAGNTTINNVSIEYCNINSNALYAGSLAGYVASAMVDIKNINIISTTISGKILNAGGVIGRAGENTSIKFATVDNACVVIASNRAGGIAAINHGLINSCHSGATINSSSTANTAGYFGGLVGFNHSSVTDSMFVNTISVSNTTDRSSGIYYFVGGLVGYNIGTISTCDAFSAEITANDSTSTVYIGGLIGYNTNTLTNCYANIESLGAVENFIYTAGISAYNFGGKISNCWISSYIKGQIASGLVYVNSNSGSIDNCMVISNNGIKGNQVSGFVYSASSGTITNCLVSGELKCTADDGWVAGIATYMACNDGNYATISYCVANVSFAGVGAKYLELAQDGLLRKNRVTGTISNCIISKNAMVDGVVVSKPDQILFWEQNAGSKSNYKVVSAEDMKKIDTYIGSGFDISSSTSKDTAWLLYKTHIYPRHAYAVADRFGG